MNGFAEVGHVPARALAAVRMTRFFGTSLTIQSDVLAVEEPLEIRLACDVDGRHMHCAVSITMRTPGHDVELAMGFLFTEGIIVAREQVAGVRACGAGNVACVHLQPGIAVDVSPAATITTPVSGIPAAFICPIHRARTSITPPPARRISRSIRSRITSCSRGSSS